MYRHTGLKLAHKERTKHNCLKHTFGQYMPVYNENIAFGFANWPLEAQILLKSGDL